MHLAALTKEPQLVSIDGIELLRYVGPEQFNYQFIVAELEDAFPVSRDRLVEILHAENVWARR